MIVPTSPGPGIDATACFFQPYMSKKWNSTVVAAKLGYVLNLQDFAQLRTRPGEFPRWEHLDEISGAKPE